ncbi:MULTISPECIES: DUF5050 domain-containing protein [unclassified Exiguobacterium]|uniref:DUF5050 domain-containing protein n=1 Tax=unclassified Exiguobacterium TaxID=2644629 RepID=UPI001BE7C26F|nr:MULTISPECIES: DUF5050 domain-containing protein [unclassified Exiguobacterium]
MKLTRTMKVMGIMVGLSVMLAGCFKETEATPQVKETTEEAKAPTESDGANPIVLRSKGELESLGDVTTHDLTLFFAHKAAMVGPEHVVDDRIIYTDSVGEIGNDVYVYDATDKSNQRIYQTSKTIGNLVGIKDELIWIEYELTEDNAYAWMIYRMKLNETKPTELAEGVSAFETPVPHLSATDEHVTWVDYEASETVTTSTIMQFSPATDAVETLQTYTLQEGEPRDGEYVFDYRDSEGGVIVHRSEFKDGEKTTKLTTLDGTFDEDMDALIDFEAGADYVALGKEGRAEFVGLTKEAKQFQHKSAQSKITFDSFRFLPNQRILFREGMNRLLVADLNEATVSYLPNRGGTTSKPIYRDGQIAYAELGDGGLITFYTINVN